jgi:hypothetical protein
MPTITGPITLSGDAGNILKILKEKGVEVSLPFSGTGITVTKNSDFIPSEMKQQKVVAKPLPVQPEPVKEEKKTSKPKMKPLKVLSDDKTSLNAKGGTK